jgi:hypothetical protein
MAAHLRLNAGRVGRFYIGVLCPGAGRTFEVSRAAHQRPVISHAEDEEDQERRCDRELDCKGSIDTQKGSAAASRHSQILLSHLRNLIP